MYYLRQHESRGPPAAPLGQNSFSARQLHSAMVVVAVAISASWASILFTFMRKVVAARLSWFATMSATTWHGSIGKMTPSQSIGSINRSINQQM